MAVAVCAEDEDEHGFAVSGCDEPVDRDVERMSAVQRLEVLTPYRQWTARDRATRRRISPRRMPTAAYASVRRLSAVVL